jgi:serine/threonine protein kinase
MASPGSDPRVRAGDESGVWYVKNTESGQVETWRVGENYRLVSVLGCGSFGAVVKSFDARSSRFVALKRVADALTTVDAAKRVLREVVVLNRLDHPNIIKIFDIFFTPATSGARVMDPATFSLVPLSIDLYMAFEIAEGGDLYEMRGEMTAREVRSLMRQLTSAVLYLHKAGVWHRDIKSANTLCGETRVGGRVVKICDFGLARGAKKAAPSRRGGSVNDDGEADLALDAAREVRRRKRHRGSFGGFGARTNESSLASFASSEDFDGQSDAKSSLASFARRDMLTTVVATPCYRAPEVIMSNGKYTGAMDVWALGCIFGELLQRQQQHALTPNLTISPLFRFDDDPVPKPGTSETYTAGARRGDAGASDDDGSRRDANADADDAERARDRSRRETRTKARLDLFFNVIGTPSWRDIDAILNLRWRRYLRGVRGRAGSITKQFAGCDENSRDLLLRMLAFDPERRATPREILAHEYFREEEASVSGAAAERRGVPRDMSVGCFDRVGSAMAVDGAAETRTEEMEDADGPTTFEMEAEDDDAGDERGRFWELSEPRAALAALETAFEDADCASSSGGQNAWRAHFREWFERECERRTRSSSAAAPKGPVSADDGDGTRSFPVLGTRDGPGDAMEASFGSFEDPSVPGRLTRAFPLFFRGGEKPVAYAGTDGVVGTRDDFESSPTPSLSVYFEQRYLGGAFGTTGVFGQGGVGESSARDFGALGDARSPLAGSPSNRNARRFASLGALGHLGANRHGEWGEEDLPSAMKRLEGLSGAEAWGVTAVPPGMTKEEGDLYRSMSNQQGR